VSKVLAGIFVWLILFSNVAAQELSTFVYPSEDELLEAFYSGEIDFIQLVTLQEIIRNGIDSSNIFLLDEIPNLSYFFELRRDEKSELVKEQAAPYLEEKSAPGPVRVRLSHYLTTELEDEGDSRYRTGGEINLKQGLKAAFRLHREYSGVERFVYRKLEYRPQNGALKRLVLGNYTTRLGLGTIIGYRGKLLDFSEEIDGESILFPDYGGYNGIQAQIKKGNSEVETVFSQTRDCDFAIRTIGGSFGLKKKIFSPSVILSMTILENRSSDESINDFKYGLNFHSKYANGYNELEISAQSGEESSFGAFLTEGGHLFGRGKVDYSLWIYSDKFWDLTAGSKAASIRMINEIEEVDFSYSDKRSGQEGGLFKTTVELSENLDFINSLIYAQRDQDDYNFEFLSAMEKHISSKTTLRLDHISRVKHRLESGGESEDIFRRSRMELRLINPEFYVRTYLAYQSKTDEDDYSSFFTNVRYKSERTGELSLWFNLGEFRHNEGRVDYWYGFVENRMELFENLKSVAKITHSYRRSRPDEHVSTASLGIELAI